MGIAPAGSRLRALAVAAALVMAWPVLHRSSAAELDRVTAGISNSSSDVGFFLADKKGYFRDEGVAVTLTPFASAALMIAPLSAGQIDVGGGTVAAGLYNAVARGIDIRIVADKDTNIPGYESSTLLIRKDLVESGRFRTLKDVKGMKVAVSAVGSGSESSLNEALKQGGLTYDDVTVVAMSFPDHLVSLRNKGIDASMTAEPTMTRILREGVAVRASPTAIYPNQVGGVVLYAPDFIAKRREVAERFMIAYIRALRFYSDALKDGRIAGAHADEVIATLVEYTAIKDPAVFRAMNPNGVHPDGRVDMATLRNDLEFFKRRGLVTSPSITVEQVVDNSFAEEADRRLGPYRRATAP